MTKSYTAKELKSSVGVKWCAGCGDHAILNALQKAIPETGVVHENIAIVSGIGCSSRLPYYMETYGMHTIHGRASAIASGLKSANQNLQVWQITGDGDCLAIGGNHFIHAIRRNIDINIILFNNEIYGLTKGQYSPTSKKGQITKTSPYGTIEQPFNPGALTIGAQGTFFARAIDVDIALVSNIFVQAAKHKGTSVIEILQNCVIFNNGAHGYITDREEKENRQILLEHGKPMIFGKNRDKGIVLNGLDLQVVTIGENGITEKDILVHDAHMQNPIIHLALINMKAPDFPVAVGIIRDVNAETYESLLLAQENEQIEKSSITCMDELFMHGNTYEIV
ncbi:MAG: 2-oxoacid:ferredoxin oxidoreductase subunit beta [Bacteroidales bacterium]|nr:2-oxoacid:ferredoxin oxidoreductase subunit beta [Bacteroidales bacterium]HPY82141.1 2-oxoacid:ferredoxin oxidoreductase subunit beta [Bacteroidales bacterium]